MTKIHKFSLIAIICICIISSIIYTYKNRISIAWNQFLYTSPLEWENATLFFDKSNIIFPHDDMIAIHSLSKPSSGAIVIMNSKKVKITDIIDRHKSTKTISLFESTSSTFKGIPCMLFKYLQKETGRYCVSIDIPQAHISINYYGSKEDYPFFKRIIDNIKIQIPTQSN